MRLESSVAPRILTLPDNWMTESATLTEVRPDTDLIHFIQCTRFSVCISIPIQSTVSLSADVVRCSRLAITIGGRPRLQLYITKASLV